MAHASVIVPCYNHARFLADALESVRAQTWPDIETIVVDDGSTDDPAAVVRRFPDVRLLTQPNQGLSRARNAGWRASRGDVLIFLDADDVLRPGAVEVAVDTLRRHPAAMMAFGRFELMDAAGRTLPSERPAVTERFYEELLRRNYIRMPGVAAIRRAALEAVGGFDPACSPSADYDLYLRIARQYPIAAHNVLVARYRQHEHNMSRNPRLMLPATLGVLERQRPFVRHSPPLRAAYVFGLHRCREFYGEQMVEQFRGALHGGRYGEMLACAWGLMRLYPAGVRKHLLKKLGGYAGRAEPAAETAAPSSRASAVPGSR